MVLHTNGWHRVRVQYCQCSQEVLAGSQIQQLLRSELFPATPNAPSTCTTFCVLETYHALTLQSKITVYDFYLTLNNLTDNTGVGITWVWSVITAQQVNTDTICIRIAKSRSFAWSDNGAI